MVEDVRKIVSQMTLEEKASLCSGLDVWHTKPVERLGIPSILMTDGPHGLRKQSGQAENLNILKSEPATCFPSGVGLASSWDRNLIKRVGELLGTECQAEGVSIVLGPAVNIKRSPLCGRNFEYLSEDPYLVSELATSYIQGVQSQGVGTSLKHFAANNQEHRRMTSDSVVDERTLREIYLTNFEGPVKNAQPWTVMCSYNKLNGTYASQNKRLLTEILRDEWGFEGFVVSDWGAVDDRVMGIEAGLELEMPSSRGLTDKEIVEAVKAGELKESVLDTAVERLLKIIFKAVENKKANATADLEAHHLEARKIASQCMVLLKNENLLPLSLDASLAVIGAFAKAPRYQGGGSSHINPSKMEIPFDEIVKLSENKTEVLYAEGFEMNSDDTVQSRIDEAKEIAAKSDIAIIFAGLPDRYESEGYDRKHIAIPENQKKLIDEVASVQANTVVVFSNGSPVEMPWLGKVKAVLEAYLGGQAMGGAVADILYGVVNPSGKLAETFPVKLSHNPSHLNFPGEGDRVEYKEGVFVGYRYYDAKQIEPLFTFGHGLSYTTFEYTDMTVDKKEMIDSEILTVTVKIKNTGDRAGSEVVQLYVGDGDSSVVRPIKELKGFEKVELQSGEIKTVSFKLGNRAFAYYNEQIKDWHVETGDFVISVGSSSKEILLSETVKVNSTSVIPKTFTYHSTMGDIAQNPVGAYIVQNILEEFKKGMEASGQKPPEGLKDMMTAIMKELPLKKLYMFSRGAMTKEKIDEILARVNMEQG